MREVVFCVLAESPGHLEARAESLPIHITAPTCTVRVRVRRGTGAAFSSIRPVDRPGALCR